MRIFKSEHIETVGRRKSTEIWFANLEIARHEYKRESKIVSWSMIKLIKNTNQRGDVVVGETLEEFMTFIKGIGSGRIIFHDLKAQYPFIQKQLFLDGFTYVTDSEIDRYKYKNPKSNFFSNHENRFQELISKSNKSLVSVSIATEGTDRVVLTDSMKLYDFTIGDMGRILDLQEPVYDNVYGDKYDVEQDYAEEHSMWVINVMFEVLSAHKQIYGKLDLTRSAMAYRLLKNSYDKSKDCQMNYYTGEAKESQFDIDFPSTTEEDFERFKEAFFGGLVLVNDDYRRKLIRKHIKAYDNNSMYPAQMANKALPVCELKSRDVFGVYTNSEYSAIKLDTPMNKKLFKKLTDLRTLRIVTISFDSFKIRQGMPPVFTKAYRASEEVKNINSSLDITSNDNVMMTNIDLSIILKAYKFEGLIVNDVYTFESEVGLFRDFVEDNMILKNNARKKLESLNSLMDRGIDIDKSEYAQAQFNSINAKSNVNSSYGKFGKNIFETEIQPHLIGESVSYSDVSYKTLNANCLFVAIFIAAWARYELFMGIQTIGWDKVLYCDTDSIHTFEDPANVKLHIDSVELGAWKIEGEFYGAYYVKSKVYAERKLNSDYAKEESRRVSWKSHSHLDMKIAGFNKLLAEQVIFDLDDFIYVVEKRIAIPTISNIVVNGQSVVALEYKVIDILEYNHQRIEFENEYEEY